MEDILVDSHVQIPKSILCGFTSKENRNLVYRMNIDGIIDSCEPKKCNIKHGYYEIKTEKILAEIESKFGLIKKKLLKGNTSLTVDEENIIKSFIAFCFARNPYIAKEVERESVYSSFFSVFDVQDVLIKLVKNDPLHYYNNLFFGYSLCLAVNNTSSSFIIAQNCVEHIQLYGSNDIMMILPISPKLAICSMKLEQEVDGILIRHINETGWIELFNKTAIYNEFITPKNNEFKYVYAQKKEDLEKYDIQEILHGAKE